MVVAKVDENRNGIKTSKKVTSVKLEGYGGKKNTS